MLFHESQIIANEEDIQKEGISRVWLQINIFLEGCIFLVICRAGNGGWWVGGLEN